MVPIDSGRSQKMKRTVRAGAKKKNLNSAKGQLKLVLCPSCTNLNIKSFVEHSAGAVRVGVDGDRDGPSER